MRKPELIFTSILPPLDFCMLLGAGLFTYFIRTNSWITQYRPVFFHLNLPFSRYFFLIIGVSLFLLFVFALVGLYKIQIRRILLDDFLKIIIGVSAGVFILVFYIFLRQELFNSRFIILAGWILSIIFVFFGRLTIHRWQQYLMKKYRWGIRRAVVIGQDGLSQKIIKQIKNQPIWGYQLVTNLVEPDIEKIKEKVKNPGIEEVILADPNWPKRKNIRIS